MTISKIGYDDKTFLGLYPKENWGNPQVRYTPDNIKAL
jgi:hypothetical protein